MNKSKHLLFSLNFLTLCFCSNAQTDNKIVIGKIDSIQSAILNENRKIWVYAPNGGSVDVYYVATGDKSNAIKQFQKALSIKENADTRKKLEKLQNK